jgi:chorismate synthase
MSHFGRLFRVSTFGESHCYGVGCIVEGVPARMRLDKKDIQQQLNRRKPGQSNITTPRQESDLVEILSGVENGYTLGTPIALLVKNEDQRPGDYSEMLDIPRPSHADLTYQYKYGIRASSGGGRASARETIGRVAAGAVAELWLKQFFNTQIIAYVSSVGELSISKQWEVDQKLNRELIDSNIVRCPDEEKSKEMQKLIESIASEADSIGGVVTCIVRNCPIGIGEPTFDKLEALLAHAMLSIPATKGFEVGSGFEGTKLKGSQHNDLFTSINVDRSQPQHKALSTGHVADLAFNTASNNSGGIQGGISNGQDIIMRIAFKPAATIGKSQLTSSFNGQNAAELKAKGRHDPCVVPRAIAIVEAMAALVVADCALLQLARYHSEADFPTVGKVNPSIVNLTNTTKSFNNLGNTNTSSNNRNDAR